MQDKVIGPDDNDYHTLRLIWRTLAISFAVMETDNKIAFYQKRIFLFVEYFDLNRNCSFRMITIETKVSFLFRRNYDLSDSEIYPCNAISKLIYLLSEIVFMKCIMLVLSSLTLVQLFFGHQTHTQASLMTFSKSDRFL